MTKLSGYLGITSVGLFVFVFLVVSTLTPGFDILHDYISKLGAKGQPLATWWNAIGFVAVGVTFSLFGWTYGRSVKDNVVGICMVVTGFGFALGAIPADFVNPDAPLSKAHFVSICLSLAGWCLGLARMGHVGAGDNQARKSANIAGVLAVIPMIGTAFGVFSAPVAHRLVLGVVFAWVVFASMRLISRKVT